MSWKRAAFAAAAVLLTQACRMEEIDLTGKACPCPSDYDCDSVCQVCVPKGTPLGSACGSSAGGGSGGTSSGGTSSGGTSSGGQSGAGAAGTGGSPCTPAITFQNFKAAWATPEAVRWEWEPLSPVSALDQFKTYELELTAAGESPRVYSGADNPELGVYVQPNSAVDFTNATTTTGLTPGKSYTAVLRAIDTKDCVLASAPALSPQTTQPKGGSFELYAENQPPGSSPLTAVEVTTGCRAGKCLRSPDCTAAGCFFNLRWTGTSLSPPISAGEFVNAYVELYVRSNSAAPLWWAATWIRLTDNSLWAFQPFSIPADDQYHKIQIPLRWYASADSQLDFASFSAGPLTEIMFIGAAPTQGTYIWVDDAYLRW
ncbi:MAG: hypothetical protein R3B13_08225 [Polyangiaceae bacterium]